MGYQENYNLTPKRPESTMNNVKRQVVLITDSNVNFYSLLFELRF